MGDSSDAAAGHRADDGAGDGAGDGADDGGRSRRDARLRRVRPDGTPVYGYDQRPGVPPIGVVRMRADEHGTRDLRGAVLRDQRHAHDFHVLAYVHRAQGSVRVDGTEYALHDGDVFGVAPGRAIEPGERFASEDALAWAVHFLPDVVPALASVSPLAWELHPLLRSFRAEIVSVPGPERDRWHGWFEELADEAAHPERAGAPDAMVAILTRVLVAAARLAPDPSSSALDPLLVRVFDQVESMFREPVSAGDVARELGYTPGHLTTVVRERSGRTVGEWLTERRLTEARRLLLETDLPLGAVAARTGLSDGAYLGRRFRERYGTSPDRWRRERRVSPR